MIRPAAFGLLISLAFAVPLAAETPAKDVSLALGVQRAMAAARDHLRAARPAEAVAVLEAELLNAEGNKSFLNLLREAYTAHLAELQARKADAATVDSVRRRLRALDGPAANGPAIPSIGSSELAATVRPPAPPIPDAPEVMPPPATLGPAPAEMDGGVAPAPGVSGGDPEDPFQQTVRETKVARGNLQRASEAFVARRYPEAVKLFAEAARRRESFTPAQRDEWAYGRLHGVAMRLNSSVVGPNELADLAYEVDDAMKAGSEHVATFGNQLMAEIRRRNPSASGQLAEGGWQVVDTANFRVLHRGQPALAAEIGQTAEAARKDMYDRWAGSPAANWSPRCNIYLHSLVTDYAKATGKPADSPGYSTVGIVSGRVVSRRIDLRLDEPTLLDAILPSEVTQVVLADLFADQPLPRWALVGMAALSESPEGVARYRRAVPAMLREKKLFAVGPFLDQPNFPDAASVTAFYAESVSLVSYLVELKGPKAFATFLREAPRRGYARALTSHYGFKDPAELQDKWVKHVLGGE
jgi:hypothetical protein